MRGSTWAWGTGMMSSCRRCLCRARRSSGRFSRLGRMRLTLGISRRRPSFLRLTYSTDFARGGLFDIPSSPSILSLSLTSTVLRSLGTIYCPVLLIDCHSHFPLPNTLIIQFPSPHVLARIFHFCHSVVLNSFLSHPSSLFSSLNVNIHVVSHPHAYASTPLEYFFCLLFPSRVLLFSGHKEVRCGT